MAKRNTNVPDKRDNDSDSNTSTTKSVSKVTVVNIQKVPHDIQLVTSQIHFEPGESKDLDKKIVESDTFKPHLRYLRVRSK